MHQRRNVPHAYVGEDRSGETPSLSNSTGKTLQTLARVRVRAIGCRSLSIHYGGEILGIGFSSD